MASPSMSRERKSRGIRATSRGYELLHQAKANKLDDEGKRFSYKRIASEAQVDEKTVGRFFNKKAVDNTSAIAIINVFGLKISDIIAPHETILENSIEDAEESRQNFLDEIKIKEEEIERFRQQGSLYESDIKRLESEKAELEICVQRLDEFLGSLKTIVTNFDQRMEFSREGASWLNERRQKDLAREAAEYVLLNHPGNKELCRGSDSAQVKQFAKDIRKYLYLIYHCLCQGRYNLLHKAIMESTIAFTLEPIAYVTAFNFIKDHKIPKDMPSIVANEI
ncbi:MAG TPA: hypothetical protein DCP31_07265, partial [Cyanobacteria bacterium UBA8543]|nr:hypothetical protein [Cyanobacteria bacterium UBA8543]